MFPLQVILATSTTLLFVKNGSIQKRADIIINYSQRIQTKTSTGLFLRWKSNFLRPLKRNDPMKAAKSSIGKRKKLKKDAPWAFIS